MPLDLLEGRGPFDPGSSTPSDDVLRSVRAEGARRRARRRHRNLALAVLCLALLAVPAVALRPGGHGSDRHLDVAADGGSAPASLADDQSIPPEIDPVPTTSPAVEAPTLPAVGVQGPQAPVPPLVAPPIVSAPVPVAPTATPKPATTATTKPACHNSSEPACGPFRWDPPLAPNQPLVASFTKAPTTAVVGQPLTFEVVWSDGDAKLSHDRFTTDGTHIVTACHLVPKYGPWSPPAPVGGSGTLTYPTSFAQPGTYHVSVELGTGDPQGPVGDDCNPVYGNGAMVETTVTVTAAAG